MLNFFIFFIRNVNRTDTVNPSSLGRLRMVFVLGSVLRGLTWFRTNIVNVQFSLCETPTPHPPPTKKSYQQTGQLSCDISWEKYISGNMGRNQCSASFLPLAELLVSAECVNKMFRLHLAGLTWHRLRSERETLTRSAARQRNSVLWHTGGFCTSLECLSDTKIFSLEQTVMHSELGRLLRYVFMYRQYIYVYTHKVWRRALSSAESM